MLTFMLRRMDLQMANLNNAMERNLGNWEKIISSTDSRLKVRQVNNPLGSAQAVIVIEYVST